MKKSKVEKEIEKTLEGVNEMLKENPAKAYVYLQYYLSKYKGIGRLMEAIWKTRANWKAELAMLMKGRLKVDKYLQPKIKELRKKEIEKLYKEMFKDGV